ncbi:hypothetical protein HMPREF9228_1258 [Bifidobacterium breve ACS-071-V-Sch8b]|nr:hypothetical protein HMPREF9228_1258 [Bifidobacterium breve ACS-071-V-Sch8b]
MVFDAASDAPVRLVGLSGRAWLRSASMSLIFQAVAESSD